jgi:hypothetical protein
LREEPAAGTPLPTRFIEVPFSGRTFVSAERSGIRPNKVYAAGAVATAKPAATARVRGGISRFARVASEDRSHYSLPRTPSTRDNKCLQGANEEPASSNEAPVDLEFGITPIRSGRVDQRNHRVLADGGPPQLRPWPTERAGSFCFLLCSALGAESPGRMPQQGRASELGQAGRPADNAR